MKSDSVVVDLGSAVGPRVTVYGERTFDEIDAALPRGWTIHEDDFQFNGVKVGPDAWAYPLSAKPQTASEMGRKGGRKTGESKRRGDSAYYRALRAKRKEAAK